MAINKASKVAIGVLITALVVVGGAYAYYTLVAKPSLKVSTSAQGVYLEDFFPEDTFVAISMDFSDENLNKLKDKFNLTRFPEIKKLMDEAFADEDAKEFLELKEEVEPLFGKSKFMIGLNQKGVQSLINEEEDTVISSYLALTVEDPEGFEKIFKEEKYDTEYVEILGNSGVKLDDEAYLVLYKDTLLFGVNEVSMEDALKRIKNPTVPSLRNNDEFRSMLNDNTDEENFGYVYMESGALLSLISESESKEIPEELKDTYGKMANDLNMTSLGFFKAQTDGIESESFVSNSGEEDPLFGDIKDYPEVYLYEIIPDKEVFFYTEMYNFKELVDFELGMLSQISVDEDEFKATFKEGTGLDWDENVTSWMDKGFAMVLQGNEGVIPAFSIYIDASSDPESAFEIMQMMDQGANGGLAVFKNAFASGDEGKEALFDKLISIENIENDGDQFTKITVSIEDITDEELKELEFDPLIEYRELDETIELYFGLTKENYIVFSNYEGLSDDLRTSTLADNEDMKKAFEYLGDHNKMVSYMNMERILRGFDRLGGLMDTYGLMNTMDSEAKLGFSIIRNILDPIKYTVDGTKAKGDLMHAKSFIKID